MVILVIFSDVEFLILILSGLPNKFKKGQFGLPKVCFGPKNLAKADHFEGWTRSAK